jgi:hypothetical protein
MLARVHVILEISLMISHVPYPDPVNLQNFTSKYSSCLNNSVVLNKRVGGIFFSPFVGENACFWKNFKSCYVKKGMLA